MNKKEMAFMVQAFKEQLIKEGKDPNDQSVKAFIRSERKKMKKLKHAGALNSVIGEKA